MQAVRKETTDKGYLFEEGHFTFTSSVLHVTGSLTNPHTDWEIEPRGRGEVSGRERGERRVGEREG